MAKQGPRKKVPKELAIINADNCTGCESCLEVCPVDCIELKHLERDVMLNKTQQWCEIDGQVRTCPSLLIPSANMTYRVDRAAPVWSISASNRIGRTATRPPAR